MRCEDVHLEIDDQSFNKQQKIDRQTGRQENRQAMGMIPLSSTCKSCITVSQCYYNIYIYMCRLLLYNRERGFLSVFLSGFEKYAKKPTKTSSRRYPKQSLATLLLEEHADLHRGAL